MSVPELKFYCNPMSRAQTIYWMLEEVAQPFEKILLDLTTKDQKAPEFLKINPMGKIPTLVHGDTVITESAAICAYLADAYPKARLAPPMDSPERGPYYRWFFFMASCFEPAVVDKMTETKRPENMSGALGYGSLEQVLKVLEDTLKNRSYLAGSEFSAVDLYCASQLFWGTSVGFVPEKNEVLQGYIKRCQQRPAFKKAYQDINEETKMLSKRKEVQVQGP